MTPLQFPHCTPEQPLQQSLHGLQKSLQHLSHDLQQSPQYLSHGLHSQQSSPNLPHSSHELQQSSHELHATHGLSQHCIPQHDGVTQIIPQHIHENVGFDILQQHVSYD